MTVQEKLQMVAFLKTLTGNNIYTDPIWSNPFANDSVIQINRYTDIAINKPDNAIKLYPNPVLDIIYMVGLEDFNFEIYSVNGVRIMKSIYYVGIDVSTFNSGIYFIKVDGRTVKFVKK